MFKPYTPEKYPMEIAGDFGTFFTDHKSPVFYVNTSFEIENIQYIKAVREILEVSEVDFDELVQRDLDDVRIKRDIVNYLTDGMGYKFFPPIVAAVTQSEDNRQALKHQYPTIKARLEKNSEYNELHVEFDNAFSVIWYVTDDEVVTLPTRLKWKPENTNLMAVDGQHRLVALQAIRGVLTNDDLKLFYHEASKNKSKLDNIKVPIVLLFFPNCASSIDDDSRKLLEKYFSNIEWNLSEKGNVKQVLRNIFVDVNKTAKQPTTSRTILLDEKDLSSVFSRIIFSSIKDQNPKVYSALLEYNLATGKEIQIEKNRATLTTIGIIHRICEYLFTDENSSDTGWKLRTSFQIDELEDFPNSEEFPKSNLKTTEFDLKQREILTKIFAERWLFLFKDFLTNLYPYRKLVIRMEQEYEQYQSSKEASTLNKENNKIYQILFGGNEKRVILENLAKIKSNTDEIITLKILKEKEGDIRNCVSNFECFYTLMFQLGFFQAVSHLLSEGMFINKTYLNTTESSNLIITLNQYIQDNQKTSLFDTKSVFYSLLFPTTKPDFSEYIASIIILILINYDVLKSKNILIKNTNSTLVLRKKLTDAHIEKLAQRVKTNLEKEFDSLTENKLTKTEIQLAKEENNPNWSVDNTKYIAKKDKYATDGMIKQIKILKTKLQLD